MVRLNDKFCLGYEGYGWKKMEGVDNVIYQGNIFRYITQDFTRNGITTTVGWKHCPDEIITADMIVKMTIAKMRH